MNLIDAVVDEKKASTMPLFHLAFRVFFLGAGVFSVVSVSLWMAVYLFGLPLPMTDISIIQWHAHEMIYGYALAVIAGFVLTAAKTWTGVQTLYGKPLALLFGLWAMARVLFLFGTEYLFWAACFDMLFVLILIVAVSHPIIKVRQWRQLAVLTKLVLLGGFNLLFYLGAFGTLDQGLYWGVYGGLYLLIGLILTMGRRVLPFFIERGVGYAVTLYNSLWLDMSSLALFVAFFINEVFVHNQVLSAWLALALFVIHGVRLAGWYTPGIWSRSLLWSLYLSFWFICLGFLLFAGVYFLGFSKFAAIHAFAFGGVGVVTLAMMSRVSLGHTGRNIRKPPRAVGYACGLLLVGALFRVIAPLLAAQYYVLWIALAQGLWILAFGMFTVVYAPVLYKPRLDGRFG